MAKVYPNARTAEESTKTSSVSTGSVVLTVWKKSLIFNRDGFTVFDKDGDLVFRVDDYYHPSDHILLMNASGDSLVTIRRTKKWWCLSDKWLVYQGEEEEASLPVLSMKKTRSYLARVTIPAGSVPNNYYQIEGSYTNKCCAIYDAKRQQRLAEIRPKEAAIGGVAIGFDVFRLVIFHPDLMDPSIAMAILIVLDLMFQSSNSLTSLNCFS